MEMPRSEVLETTSGKIYLGPDALAAFCATQAERGHRIFLLTDTNTQRDCLPLLAPHLQVDAHYSMPAGEVHKGLQECSVIWQALTTARFDRGDLVVNLGGGVVCDLGGFAASTYKRGIRFVHIPTTLLAMADAAVGGKTGIDFGGYKNQVGTFQQPHAIVVHAPFLRTLPMPEILSGYAEVVKHFLIHDAEGWHQMPAEGLGEWPSMPERAIRTKLHFTENDPKEHGIRKALNFGHTVGHALESHFLTHSPVLHGFAVAAGMWCEAWLSLQRQLLDAATFSEISTRLTALFLQLPFTAEEQPAIARWALQDKKNQAGRIRCCLLTGIGSYVLDQELSLAEVEASLDAYRTHLSSR